MMYRDRAVCRAVYEGVPPGTPVFGLAGTCQEEVAKELGLPFVAELYGASLSMSSAPLLPSLFTLFALPLLAFRSHCVDDDERDETGVRGWSRIPDDDV